MGRLLLVRHGQASFGAADYDVLSDLGHAQARALGAHLATHVEHIDRVVVGPRVRQRDTATGIVSAAAEGGLTLPDLVEHAALDEFPAFEIAGRHLPRLAKSDPHVRDMLGGDHDALDLNHHGMGQALARCIRLWSEGAFEVDDDLERFVDFRARVTAFLNDMRDQAVDETVLAVTSGGPVGVAVLNCLHAPNASFLDVSWNVRNASVTELRTSTERTTLMHFNLIGHLDPTHVTNL